MHAVSRRISQCLRMKAAGDERAAHFFVSNTALLSIASQVASKLYGQKGCSWDTVEGLLVQKLVLFIYLNLRATTEASGPVKVSAGQVRACVQLPAKMLSDLKEGTNSSDAVQSASGALYSVLVQ